ncbi:unnamed protein product, partial [Amoebophrya sp. A120]
GKATKQSSKTEVAVKQTAAASRKSTGGGISRTKSSSCTSAALGKKRNDTKTTSSEDAIGKKAAKKTLLELDLEENQMKNEKPTPTVTKGKKGKEAKATGKESGTSSKGIAKDKYEVSGAKPAALEASSKLNLKRKSTVKEDLPSSGEVTKRRTT